MSAARSPRAPRGPAAPGTLASKLARALACAIVWAASSPAGAARAATLDGAEPTLRPGGSAPPMLASAAPKDGAFGEAKASDAPAAPGPLEKLLRSLKADGPLKLPEPALAEVAALLPGSGRGEECAVMALSPGLPMRVSRLLDLEGGESLSGAYALNLSGNRREDDLGVALSVQPHRSELRLLARRAGAFAFSGLGAIRELGEQGDCSAGGEVAAGFTSFLKVDSKGRLEVLRVDASCGAGPWAARCALWSATRAAVEPLEHNEHIGVCALPSRLDAKSLRAAGWK